MSDVVFMVSRGCYSDYRVVGIYSTRDKAQAMVDAVKRTYPYDYDAAEIEEIELDCGAGEVSRGLLSYYVDMNQDGDTRLVIKGDAEPHASANGLRVYEHINGTRSVVGYVWATNPQHAVKIANEYRTMAIANGKL